MYYFIHPRSIEMENVGYLSIMIYYTSSYSWVTYGCNINHAIIPSTPLNMLIESILRHADGSRNFEADGGGVGGV